jgi:hypothetical protein
MEADMNDPFVGAWTLNVAASTFDPTIDPLKPG